TLRILFGIGYWSFFFFQAEDGIRDKLVTGVQTCALPISTLFFAEYNDATRHLRYANCGHLAALLLRSDNSLERLESTATVLGVFKKWDCAITAIQISAGDIFALYTDGITESFNDAGEEFGEERLAAALCRHRALSSSDLLTAVVDEVRQFSPREQQDDITLIVAKST